MLLLSVITTDARDFKTEFEMLKHLYLSILLSFVMAYVLEKHVFSCLSPE
jgi:hypothetical protein